MCPDGTRYFPDATTPNKCVKVEPSMGGVENCDPCQQPDQPSPPSVGQPINPGTGNMWHIESDYVSATPGGLRVVRTYNSTPNRLDARTSRSFGVRWTQPYDAFLQQEAPITLGSYAGLCWRRTDTGYTWCETPSRVPSALPDAISIVRGYGGKLLFNRTGTGWVADGSVNDRVSATLNADGTQVTGYNYVAANGDVKEYYGASGRRYSVTTRSGMVQYFVYSDGTTNDTRVSKGASPGAPACTHVHPGSVLPAGRLLCVVDNWGRQINFEYDIKGRVVKMYDPADQVYTYEYDGPSGGCATPDIKNRACLAGNLTKVTYPDTRSRTYYYNEAARINGGTSCANIQTIGNGFGHLLNALTGIVDENNVRTLSWSYDCAGGAQSSELAGGMEKVELAYNLYDPNGNSTTTVKHYYGDPANPQTTTRTFNYQLVLGQAKNTAIDGACVECGPYKARTYDANGNIKTATDWNGNVTTYTYDLTRNLETQRVEASGTPQARTITTRWHATYRLPVKVFEPKKLTTYDYDPSGNLQTRTEQATTDTTGVQGLNATTTGMPRKWQYTYNQYGQVLTAKGPRTDLDDTTTYTYDSTTGNLLTVKNAAGLVTKFGNYDAHGRVGRITDPNGLVTDLTYWPRGWLKSKTVTGNYSVETTTYEYDNVGQLTQVTLPDSVLHYRYDDAHRLTDISDSLGNSIHYTLDARGNRTKEEVKDAKGILARQVTRVFDALSRLQQVTGAAQ